MGKSTPENIDFPKIMGLSCIFFTGKKQSIDGRTMCHKSRSSDIIWVNLIMTSLFSRTLGIIVFFLNREIIPFFGRTIQASEPL